MAVEMLNTLKRIVQQVNQAAELDDALQLLVGQTKSAMEVDCCSVYLADHDRQCFELMATDGLDRSAVGRVALSFSEGLVGLVGQREEPINVADAQAHPRFKYFPEVKEELLCAFLGTPIIHQRKVMGVLVVQQREARQFSANEEAFLVTLAAQLAHVLADAQVRGMLSIGHQGGRTTPLRSLRGVPGAPGVVIGRAHIVAPSIELDAVTPARSDEPALELQRFADALAATRADLINMQERMGDGLAQEFHAILEMYGQLANDPAIARAVQEEIGAGWNAETAVKRVFDRYVGQFEAMQDNYLRERAADVRDLISVPPIGEDDRDQPTQVSKALLTRIISARIEETLEMLRDRIQKSGFSPVVGKRVVLTGGACQLTGMPEAALARARTDAGYAVAWLSLGPGDDEPARFLLQLIDALIERGQLKRKAENRAA